VEISKPSQVNINVVRGSNKWVVSTLALAISSAMFGQVMAEEVNLDTVVIEDNKAAPEANPYAEPDAPYKAKKLSDSKRTRNIAETPQTMTVLTKEALLDSGKTELKDILSAQPGITLGTGEGGNSFGDRYIIRGYEARNDVFADGLRDPGLITRETFAIEQIEITKGPSSTFAGRGSTGGAVNSVTKKASLDDDFLTLSGGIGTDEYQRYTLDGNKVLTDDLAIRLNVLYSDADIPDRAPAEERRKGALFSGVYEPTDALRLTADYYYFRADDRTDPGVIMRGPRGGTKTLDPHVEYVGQDGLDFQESEADIFTFGFESKLSDGVTLENNTRIGETANDYIISTFSPASSSNPDRTRTFSKWQENDYIGNQTNLIIDRNLWGKRHTVVTGVEFAKEKTDSGSYNVDPSSVAIDPYNPNNNAWSGTYNRNDATAKLELKTVSAYVMDTITLSDEWEVFAGVRYDYFDYDLWTAASNGRGGPQPERDRSFAQALSREE